MKNLFQKRPRKSTSFLALAFPGKETPLNPNIAESSYSVCTSFTDCTNKLDKNVCLMKLKATALREEQEQESKHEYLVYHSILDH